MRQFWLARAGEVHGPYLVEQLREMNAAGELLAEDQFCAVGEEEVWVPYDLWRKLHVRTDTVKVPVRTGTVKVPVKLAKGKDVTAKQRALLEYLGWVVPGTRAEASALIDAAINDPRLSIQMEGWRMDRLQLHPELYAEEKAASREWLPGVFHRHINENLGPWNPLKRITLQMAQDAVLFLDARYAGWDARVWQGGFPDYDEVDRWSCAAIAATHPEAVKKGRWGDFGPGRPYQRL